MLEYVMLAYRALLPCGTWYRYFLCTDVSPYMASAVTGEFCFRLVYHVEHLHSVNQVKGCVSVNLASVAVVLAGMYLSFKLSMIWDRLGHVMQSVKTVAKCDAQYGQYATHDEVMECGGVCSICQVRCTQRNPLSFHRLPAQ
jgi:hypothetical protein